MLVSGHWNVGFGDDGRLSGLKTVQQLHLELTTCRDFNWPRNIKHSWTLTGTWFTCSHWMLANSLHLLLLCPVPCSVFSPFHLLCSHPHKRNCTKLFASPSVRTFRLLTLISFIFLINTFITVTFIDPTLAKIVNYSSFIWVSRIRCLKKEMSVS